MTSLNTGKEHDSYTIVKEEIYIAPVKRNFYSSVKPREYSRKTHASRILVQLSNLRPSDHDLFGCSFAAELEVARPLL